MAGFFPPFPFLKSYLVGEIMEKNKYTNEELYDLSVDPSLSPKRRSYYQGLCVMQNLGLIMREVSKTCATVGNPSICDDLKSEGKLGWIIGMNKFNRTKYPTIKIATYCLWWATAYIKAYYKNNYKEVKVLTTDAKKKAAVLLARNDVKYQDADGNVDFEKMSTENFIKEEILREVNDALHTRYVSVSPSDDEDIPVLDLKSSSPSPYVLLSREESKKILEDKLKTFMEMHAGVSRSIIENRMYNLLTEDSILTLEEIGKKFSMTKQYVQQIEEKLLEKFRKQLVPVSAELRAQA